jgi:hypothetical protein
MGKMLLIDDLTVRVSPSLGSKQSSVIFHNSKVQFLFSFFLLYIIVAVFIFDFFVVVIVVIISFEPTHLSVAPVVNAKEVLVQ